MLVTELPFSSVPIAYPTQLPSEHRLQCKADREATSTACEATVAAPAQESPVVLRLTAIEGLDQRGGLEVRKWLAVVV